MTAEGNQVGALINTLIAQKHDTKASFFSASEKFIYVNLC